MTLVLDASIALGWYFEDESSAIGDALLDRVIEEGATVPALWRYEVANGFQTAVRRKRIDAAYRDASLTELRMLPITVDRAGSDAAWSGPLLGFADRYRLTVYDAAYLELAYRLGLALATADNALRKAAQALQIDWVGA